MASRERNTLSRKSTSHRERNTLPSDSARAKAEIKKLLARKLREGKGKRRQPEDKTDPRKPGKPGKPVKPGPVKPGPGKPGKPDGKMRPLTSPMKGRATGRRGGGGKTGPRSKK